MSIVRTLPGIDVREQVRAVGVLAHRLPGGVPLLGVPGEQEVDPLVAHPVSLENTPCAIRPPTSSRNKNVRGTGSQSVYPEPVFLACVGEEFLRRLELFAAGTHVV